MNYKNKNRRKHKARKLYVSYHYVFMLILCLGIGCQENSNKNSEHQTEEVHPFKKQKPNSVTELNDNILKLVVKSDSVFNSENKYLDSESLKQLVEECATHHPNKIINLKHDNSAEVKTIMDLMDLSYKHQIQMTLNPIK